MEKINVFWFKRDLRLEDNPALQVALSASEKVLLIYLFEPSLLNDGHYSQRHWRFVTESLNDLDERLSQFDTKIVRVVGEAQSFFRQLADSYSIANLYSTQETGIALTFERDKAIQSFCWEEGIQWHEFQNNGVIRGLSTRNGWSGRWYRYMTAKIEPLNFSNASFFSTEDAQRLQKSFTSSKGLDTYAEHLNEEDSDATPEHPFQKGGRTEALHWQKSFFEERIEFYNTYVSKPEMSRYGCSRLSPYIAWGVLSIREIYQELRRRKPDSPFKRQLNSFSSRLRWQSHFIQKFEMEPRMEFEAVNKGFLELPQPLNSDYVVAWKNGRTGYPLVDASMRCVARTGYINFRMRSMVVSFLTHHLFQHFTTGAQWLARQFLDFEAGIHYGQFQMQAGFTGTNTVRVYNPTKNAKDHDADAVFIKKHVPELADLPAHLAIEPWSMTEMESQLYDFKLGIDYPERIVDIQETRKIAVTKLYGQRKSELARRERQRILDRHTIKRKPDRRKSDKSESKKSAAKKTTAKKTKSNA